MQIAGSRKFYSWGSRYSEKSWEKRKERARKQEEKFSKGAINNGINKDIASFIFKNKTFAEYGFNKVMQRHMH